MVKLGRIHQIANGGYEQYMYYRTVKNYPKLGAVSLGEYRIMFNTPSMTTCKHEYGHTKQSRMLGPVYLLFIGLPSVIGNLLNRIIKFDYYKQPWEAWADKLGGVER